MEQNRTLNGKQAKFLACLLAESSIDSAAEQAGIAHSTAFRYLQEPAFAECYAQEQRRVIDVATARLQAACSGMVDVLKEIAEDAGQPASARVSAARSVLDLAYKAVELQDQAERLAAIEKTLADLGPEEGATRGRRAA